MTECQTQLSPIEQAFNQHHTELHPIYVHQSEYHDWTAANEFVFTPACEASLKARQFMRQLFDELAVNNPILKLINVDEFDISHFPHIVNSPMAVELELLIAQQNSALQHSPVNFNKRVDENVRVYLDIEPKDISSQSWLHAEALDVQSASWV